MDRNMSKPFTDAAQADIAARQAEYLDEFERRSLAFVHLMRQEDDVSNARISADLAAIDYLLTSLRIELRCESSAVRLPMFGGLGG